MPRTILGKWAGCLLVVCVVLLLWGIVSINTGLIERGSLPAMVSGVSMAVASVATLVLSLVSRLKYKDRSPVVLVAIIFGVLLGLVLSLELLGG